MSVGTKTLKPADLDTFENEQLVGAIEVGEEARIAAGSVVLASVPARCTVAGVPARPVGGVCCEEAPSEKMDQLLEEQILAGLGEGI